MNFTLHCTAQQGCFCGWWHRAQTAKQPTCLSIHSYNFNSKFGKHTKHICDQAWDRLLIQFIHFINLAHLSCQKCNHLPGDECQPGKPNAIYQLLAEKYLKSLKKKKQVLKCRLEQAWMVWLLHGVLEWKEGSTSCFEVRKSWQSESDPQPFLWDPCIINSTFQKKASILLQKSYAKE